MRAEIDIYGVYVPTFLVLTLVAYVINQALRRVFSRIGLYAAVWHRALFDLGLYVIVLGATYSLFRRLA